MPRLAGLSLTWLHLTGLDRLSGLSLLSRRPELLSWHWLSARHRLHCSLYLTRVPGRLAIWSSGGRHLLEHGDLLGAHPSERSVRRAELLLLLLLLLMVLLLLLLQLLHLGLLRSGTGVAGWLKVHGVRSFEV